MKKVKCPFVASGSGPRQKATLCGLLLLAGLSGLTAAQAARYYWDANGTAAGLYGTGDWNTTDSTWRTPGSTDPLTPWVNGNTAYLLGASTLNLTENISMLGSYNQSWGTDITFNTTNGSSLTLAGTSWMNHGGGGVVTYNVPVSLAADFQPSGTGPAIFNQSITGNGYRVIPGANNDLTFNAANSQRRTSFNALATTIRIGHDGVFGPYAGGTPASDSDYILWFAATAGANHTFQAVNGARSVNNGLWMNGALLQLNLAGTNALEFSGNLVTPTVASTLTLNATSSADTTFSGVISRGANVVKTGPGRLILSGNNTYSGTTAVSNGTLLVNGATTGQGNYTVAAGTTLGGTGTVGLASGKSLTVAGTLCPGIATNAPGTLTVSGAATLAENSVYQWACASGSSGLLNVSGALTLPTVATVTVSLVSGSLPKSAVICSAGSLAGAGDLSGWVVTGADAGACATVEGTAVKLLRLTPAGGTVVCVR